MKHSTARIYSALILMQIVCSTNVIGQKKSSYKTFAGNTHAHTAHTWSHGSHLVKAGVIIDSLNLSRPKNGTTKPDWRKHQGFPAEHFAAAKANGYDFYISTDHSQEPDFYPTSANSAAWLATKKAATEATDNKFVALVGFEYSENNSANGKGHINVINSSTYINALEPHIDLPYLYKWLASVSPNGEGPVVASFNHPGPEQYNSFGYRDEKVTDIITMLELINSNKNVHYEGFIKALDAGWKVSPVAGNDNHGLGAITTQNSRTFVLATDKSKAAILDAMKNRRTYASFDSNIACWYSVNGKVMGSTLKSGAKDFKFEISVADPDTNDPGAKITKIDIVKDGGIVVESYSPTPAHSVRWTPTIRNADSKYFLVRVWSVRSSNPVATEKESKEVEEASENENPAKDTRPKMSKAPIAKPVAWLAPVWTGR